MASDDLIAEANRRLSEWCDIREAPSDPQMIYRLKEALEAAEVERDAYKRAKAENDERFMRERDEARLENAALRAKIERVRVLHRPVHPVFNWNSGLRFEEPCPDCSGKAGVHPCGCWSDDDIKFECLECAQPKGGGSRRVMPWPCPTARALDADPEQSRCNPVDGGDPDA